MSSACPANRRRECACPSHSRKPARAGRWIRSALFVPGATLAILLSPAPAPAAPPALQTSDPQVRVDQFGYLPLGRKVAVLREPVIGYDAPAPYTPGASIEVRRGADHGVAFSASASAWKGGEVHSPSGDRAWWLDFSSLQEEGDFYLHDPATGVSSESFAIAPDVFTETLSHALRFHYYQRCGTPKELPYADSSWVDAPCHLGAEQDLDCRYVLDPSPASARDLAGGWHDAGDYHKYVNYADGALHDLLGAYEAHPEGWRDDHDLPESGNGIPDLLDEIKWELDWLLKMQLADGSVTHKMGVTDWSAASPPSADTGQRRYSPATASATISACGVWARAALAYGVLPDPTMRAFAARLRGAALAAWSWLEANPGQIPSSYDNAGFSSSAAEDDAYWQEMNRVRAAAFLFALTSDDIYRVFFDSGYSSAHLFLWWWASPWEQEIQDGLLFYAALPGATPAVADAINTRYEMLLQGADHLGRVQSAADAYRAFLFDDDHTWGSNRTKSQQGLMYAAMNRHGLDPVHAADYLSAASDFLHYLHGVNPVGYSFLTNMAGRGAEGSITETNHAWFQDGTVWDSSLHSLYGPAPGILTGGVNPHYQPAPEYIGPPIEPPENQPILKSYRDWNTGWPQNSWEVTECQLASQGSYLRLLAELAAGPPPALSLAVDALEVGEQGCVTVGGADPGQSVAVLWSLHRGPTSISVPGWVLELGIDLGANPAGHVAMMGVADSAGVFADSLPVPPAAAGRTLHFQAAQGGSEPYPVHSAVITRTVAATRGTVSPQ